MTDVDYVGATVPRVPTEEERLRAELKEARLTIAAIIHTVGEVTINPDVMMRAHLWPETLEVVRYSQDNVSRAVTFKAVKND